MPPKAKYPCIVCKQNVSDRDSKGSINCNVCQRYTHAPCANLDSKMLGWFRDMEAKTGKHCYSCEGCALGYHQMDIKIAQLDKRMREMEDRNTEAREESAQTKDKVEKVEKEVKEVKADMKSVKEDTAAICTKAWSRELRERKARELNVIVYGLLELPITARRGEERKRHDTAELSAMLDELECALDMDNLVKFMVRVGDMREDVAENPRPLKVGLRSSDIREKIFDKAKQLPQSSYSTVSIAPDLTKQQRDEEKELAEEAKRLTEEQNEEDFLVFEYRLVGRKGERVIRKLKKQVNGQTRGFSGRARGGRGQGRGRVNPRGRGAHSNPNLTPVRHQNRHNRSTDTLVGGEEEEEDNEANKRKRSDGSLVISPSSPGFSGTTKRAKRAAAAAAATEAAAEAEEEED